MVRGVDIRARRQQQLPPARGYRCRSRGAAVWPPYSSRESTSRPDSAHLARSSASANREKARVLRFSQFQGSAGRPSLLRARGGRAESQQGFWPHPGRSWTRTRAGGVLPAESRAPGSAPDASRAVTDSGLPRAAAACRGSRPFSSRACDVGPRVQESGNTFRTVTVSRRDVQRSPAAAVPDVHFRSGTSQRLDDPGRPAAPSRRPNAWEFRPNRDHPCWGSAPASSSIATTGTTRSRTS